jgi:hypothetical protein
MPTQRRRSRQLTKDEALRRLASVSVGRIVLTAGGLPTIRPVNHVLDRRDVVICAHLGSANLSPAGTVVAYEADLIDDAHRTGWSVIVTGLARVVENPSEIAKYEELIRPWVTLPDALVIRIQTDVISGFELTDD